MDDISARRAMEADLLPPPRPPSAHPPPDHRAEVPAAPPLSMPAPPPPPDSADVAQDAILIDADPSAQPPVEPPPVLTAPPPDVATSSVLAPLIRSAVPWASSLCLNLAGLVVLALIALPLLVEDRTVVELTAAASAVEEATEVQTINIASWHDSPDTAPEAFQEMTTVADEPEVEDDQQIDDPDAIVSLLAETPTHRTSVPSGKMLDITVSPAIAAGPPSPKELNEAGSVEEAVDGIGSQIGEMLGEGDLLVVWLLDASLSLVDDRQRVSARLESVYAGIGREQQLIAERTGGEPPRLTSAVVAFGGGMAEVVSPTGRIGRAANAVKDIPIDQTGLENVYSAVATCVRKYGGNIRRRLFLVIWTDESGDDIALLEPTIALCKQEQVRVSIIGPTAVLGAEEGTHAWVHPENRRVYYLPVKKGPDTALPERLQWPYWWQTSLPAWHEHPLGTRLGFEGWYGGRQLASIASGFPPYSLTRLARETGGSMTILDREIDRGPFRLSVMRPYSPDHRPAAQILDDLRYHPLRLAVLQAAEITRTFPGHEPPPTSIYYISAAPMRRRLRHTSDELAKGAAAIEKALAAFGPEPDGMEHLFLNESSPRWRAWYDLTRGRLLAQSVRYAEFRALCKLLSSPDGLPDDINCLQIEPTPRLLLGSSSEMRAREAERHLKRCLAEHAATPWAYLAQRELDHALGVAHLAYYREPPVPAAPGPAPAAVTLPKL